MTMNVSSVSSSSAVASTSATSSASSTAPVNGAVFSNSLAQLMSNTSTTTTANPALWFPLPQLADASMLESDEQLALLEQLMAQLEGLLKETQQQIEADPALFADMQQWMVQTQELLTQLSQGTVTGEQQAAIQMLMKQPQTMGIVLMDQAEQLVQHARILTNQAATDVAPAKVQEVLQSLKQLGELLLSHNSSKPAAMQLSQTLSNVIEPVTKETPTEPVRNVISVQPQQEGATAAKSSESSVSLLKNDGMEMPSQQMTVGQFALRAEGLTSTKPVQQVPIQQFAPSMSEMLIKQMSIRTLNGTSEAKITLYPEHLGQVDIKITMQNGQLIAQFVTENAMAKDMIDQQLATLRGALQATGIQVEKLEVSQQQTPEASAMASSMFQGDRQSHSSQDQQTSKKSVSKIDATEMDLNDLDGLQTEEDMKPIATIVPGSSFDASA